MRRSSIKISSISLFTYIGSLTERTQRPTQTVPLELVSLKEALVEQPAQQMIGLVREPWPDQASLVRVASENWPFL